MKTDKLRGIICVLGMLMLLTAGIGSNVLALMIEEDGNSSAGGVDSSGSEHGGANEEYSEGEEKPDNEVEPSNKNDEKGGGDEGASNKKEDSSQDEKDDNSNNEGIIKSPELPDIADIILDTGRTDYLGGGNYVGINMDKDTFFAVIYGTEENPNAITLVSMYTRYAGVADIEGSDDYLDEEGVGIPVQTIFSQRLDSIYEFKEDYYEPVHDDIDPDEFEDDDTWSYEESDGTESPRTREGDEYPSSEESEMHELLRSVNLEGAWTLSKTIDKNSDHEKKVWGFTLTRENIGYKTYEDNGTGNGENEYAASPGAVEDKTREEYNQPEEVLDSFQLDFEMELVIKEVPLDRVPSYDFEVSDDGFSSKMGYENGGTGVLIELRFSYSKSIIGWDVEPVNEETASNSEGFKDTSLFMKSFTLLGNHISPYVPAWLKEEVLESIEGDGDANYLDEYAMEKELDGREGEDEAGSAVIYSHEEIEFDEAINELQKGEGAIDEYILALVEAFRDRGLSLEHIKETLIVLHNRGIITKSDMVLILIKADGYGIIDAHDIIWILIKVEKELDLDAYELMELMHRYIENGYDIILSEELVEIFLWAHAEGYLDCEELLTYLKKLSYHDKNLYWKDIYTLIHDKEVITTENWADLVLHGYNEGLIEKNDIVDIIIEKFIHGDVHLDLLYDVLQVLYEHGALDKRDFLYILESLLDLEMISEHDLLLVLFDMHSEEKIGRDEYLELLKMVYDQKLLGWERWTELLHIGYLHGYIQLDDIAQILSHAKRDGHLDSDMIKEIIQYLYFDDIMEHQVWLSFLQAVYEKGVIDEGTWIGLVFWTKEIHELEPEILLHHLIDTYHIDGVKLEAWIRFISHGINESYLDEEMLVQLFTIAFSENRLTRRDITDIFVHLDQHLSYNRMALVIAGLYSETKVSNEAGLNTDDNAFMDLDDLRIMLFDLHKRIGFSLTDINGTLVHLHGSSDLSNADIGSLLQMAFLSEKIDENGTDELLGELQNENVANDQHSNDTTNEPPVYDSAQNNMSILENDNTEMGNVIDNIMNAFKNHEDEENEIRLALFQSYNRGEISYQDLLELSVAFLGHYNHTIDDEVGTYAWLVIGGYDEGFITFSEMRDLIMDAFLNEVISTDELYDFFVLSYHKSDLSINDIHDILFRAMHQGKISIDDLTVILFRAQMEDVFELENIHILLKRAFDDGLINITHLKRAISKAYMDGNIELEELKTLLSLFYRNGELTHEDIRRIIKDIHASGDFSKHELKWIIVMLYKENGLNRTHVKKLLVLLYDDGMLTRDELKWLLHSSYEEGNLTRDDLRWLIFHAYKVGELTRDDLWYLAVMMYSEDELERSDLRWLIFHAYGEGELTREDVKWIIFKAYDEGELTKEDVKWLIVHAYNEGKLTRKDMKWIIIHAYNEELLTKPILKWILINAYEEGELTLDDVRWILFMAFKENELTLEDVKWIIGQAYYTGELDLDEFTELLLVSLLSEEINRTHLGELLGMCLDSSVITIDDTAHIIEMLGENGIFEEENLTGIVKWLYEHGSIEGYELIRLLMALREKDHIGRDIIAKIILSNLISKQDLAHADLALFLAALIKGYENKTLSEEDLYYIIYWAVKNADISGINETLFEQIMEKLRELEIFLDIDYWGLIEKKGEAGDNGLYFKDNWQDIGKFRWDSHAFIWKNDTSNDPLKVPVHYYILDTKRLEKRPNWFTLDSEHEGEFNALLMEGGFIYPAAYKIEHGSSFSASNNMFIPLGGQIIIPEIVDGRIRFTAGYDKRAEIPLTLDSVKEVDFLDELGRRLVKAKFFGEGTVSWKLKDLTGLPQKAQDDLPTDKYLIGDTYQADITGQINWYWMMIDYSEDDLPYGISEDSLKVYYWDENSNGWQVAEETWIDTENNVIYANVTHFTIFAPMAEQHSDTGTPTTSGSGFAILIIIILAVVLAIVVVIALYTKRRNAMGEQEPWEDELPSNEIEIDWERYMD